MAAGKPDESLLLELIIEGEMPPEEDKQLSKDEIATIRRWIESGAEYPGGSSAPSASVTQFQVEPILLRRCTVCHGSQYVEGDLDLRSKARMLQGGKGGPAFVSGDAEASLMVQRVQENLCPPKPDIGEAGIEPMTPGELDVLKSWIKLGAPLAENDSPKTVIEKEDLAFWSFRSPRKAAPPKFESKAGIRNPIDAFLLDKLRTNQLSFSPPADKQTLVRRATFDLTGLPPTPAEVDAFLKDDSPQAYEKLIDRLLKSPRYGERWGRLWLDLAGYADSEGKRNADTVRPWAWRYRDYVIRSFNADKPYDQFLLEQIAGDELVDYAKPENATAETIEKLTATGFLRMAPDGTSADPVNRISDRVEVIARRN